MKMRMLVGGLVGIVLLDGCGPSSLPATSIPDTVTAPPSEESATQIAVFTIVPTPEVMEETPLRPGIDCAWNWATQEVPELQAKVDAAVREANLTGVTVHTYIFGEDCLDKSGQAVTFATMETDFDVSIEVTDLADREEVGNRLADVFSVLAQFDPESTPGPQAGRIQMNLHSGEESQNLSVGVATALEAVQQELRGAALMDFLEGPTF